MYTHIHILLSWGPLQIFGIMESTFGDKAQNFRPTASVAFLTSKANPLPAKPPPCTSLFWKFVSHPEFKEKNLGERTKPVPSEPTISPIALGPWGKTLGTA